MRAALLGLVLLMESTSLLEAQAPVDPPPEPVSDLACEVGMTAAGPLAITVAIDLSWSNAGTYDSLELSVNEVLRQTLAGVATTASVEASPGELLLIDVRPVTTVAGARSYCTVSAPEVAIAPSNLRCEPDGATGSIALSWALGGSYDGIVVLAGGALQASLPGDATDAFIHPFSGAPSTVTIDIVASYSSLDLVTSCTVEFDAASCDAPGNLTVSLVGNSDVSGSFTNPGGLSSLQVLRDGAVYLALSSGATGFDDPAPPAGRVVYDVMATCPDGSVVLSGGAAVMVPSSAQVAFIRSDCNDDSEVDIADAIFQIGALFLLDETGYVMECDAACDANGDHHNNIADIIFTLSYLFRDGVQPPAPFPLCGSNSGGALTCDAYSSCVAIGNSFATGWTHTQTAYLAGGEQGPPPSSRKRSLRPELASIGLALDPALGSFRPASMPFLDNLFGMACGRIRGNKEPSHVEVPNLSTLTPSGGIGVTASLCPHSGELIVCFEPPSSNIPSRGGFCHCRATYRSQIDYAGPAGPGWVVWPLSERIEGLANGGVRWFDSFSARVDVFDPVTLTAPGRDTTVRYDSAFNRYIIRSGATGETRTFFGPGSEPFSGLLIQVRDRFGNAMTCEYDDNGRLTSTVDDMGRNQNWFFGDKSLLSSITDSAGRVTSFSYNEAGQLTDITLPAVTGTPVGDDTISSNGSNGNDFPDGAMWSFRYRDDPYAEDVVRDNLVSITAPNETVSGGGPRMTFEYGEEPTDPLSYDRVKRLALPEFKRFGIGDTAPALAILAGVAVPRFTAECSFSYQQLADFIPGDVTTPVRRVTAVDGNGNNINWDFNSSFSPVACHELVARGINPNDPESFDWLFEVDHEYRIVAVETPEGSRCEFDYEQLSPNRGSIENLLEARWIADLDRDGDQDVLTTSYTYEPIFNQLRSVTTPRGNDENYVPLVPDDPAHVVAVDFDLDGQNDVVLAGETTRRFRYTTHSIFDYQEGTPGEILDLADAEGISLDLDGAGPITANAVADALSIGDDVNGDGSTAQASGSRIKVRFPWLSHEDGSADEITSDFTYNEFGQLTSIADPEGILTTFEYYPESDPDGNGISEGLVRPADDETGGYLKSAIVDARPPTPFTNSGTNRRTRAAAYVEASTHYEYDPAGNVTAVTDARGVRSERAVNAWNLVTRETRATAPFTVGNDPPEMSTLDTPGYRTDYTYDYNGRCVRVQVEDRGNTSNVASAADLMPSADTYFVYDILDHVVEVQTEVTADEHIANRYRYDGNGNLVLHIAPEGNATTWVYDDRNMVASETRGAIALPPLVRLAVGDPTLSDLEGGGLPARRFFTYDGIGHVAEATDCDDTDASVSNNSSLVRADRRRWIYDGFDRCVSMVDAAGNQSVCQYDPDGNVVRCAVFGATGGATPTSDGPDPLARPVSSDGVIQSSNLVSSSLLRCTEWGYNEAGAVLRSDKVLFYGGAPTMRPVDILDGGGGGSGGSLTPGDDQAIPGVSGVSIVGRVSEAIEYDRNLAVTRSIEDDLGETNFELDGLNRVIVIRYELSDSTADVCSIAYDDMSNVIEVQETDVDPAGILPDEMFVTTYEYDSLGRCVREIDSLGQTWEARYSSRGHRIVLDDSKGPPGETITRRAFAGGALTSNVTNGPGNVTRFAYDGLSRLILSETILTASGDGDGVHVGADADGVWGDVPTPDSAQGGGDGIARSAYLYDGNSRLTGVHDDRGDLSLYLYDNLDRCVLEIEGLTLDSDVDLVTLLDGRSVPAPTRATRRAPKTLGVDLLQGMVDRDLVLDGNRFGGLFTATADPVAPAALTIHGLDPEGLDRIVQTPNRGEIHHDYDALGRVVRSRCFGAGQPAALESADDGFATKRYHPDGTVVWAESGTRRLRYEYDGLSRLVRGRADNDPLDDDDDCDLTLAWDSLGRCVEEQSSVGANAAVAPTYATSRAWRAENRCVALTYPDGRVITYEHDALDRCIEIADSSTGHDRLTTSYFGLSRVASRTFGNGTSLSFAGGGSAAGLAFDGAQRPTSLRHVGTDGTDLLSFTHTFDRAGAITLVAQAHDPDNDAACTYDSASRLVGFDRPAPGAVPPHFSSWSLDAEGNWEQVDGESRSHDSRNQIAERVAADGTSTLLAYDDNGNLRSDGTRTYSYDTLGRIVEVASTSPAVLPQKYAYDALGRRVRMSTQVPGAVPEVARYIHDGDREIEERSSGGGVTHQFVWDYSADLGSGDALTVQYNPKEVGLDKSVPWGARGGGGGGGGGCGGLIGISDDTINMLFSLVPGVGPQGDPDFDADGALRVNPNDTWDLVVGSPRSGKESRRKVFTNNFDVDLCEDITKVSAITRPRFTWTQLEGPFYIDQDDDGDGVITIDEDSHFYCHRDVEGRTCALTDAAGTLVEAQMFEPSGRPITITPGSDGVLEFGGDDEYLDNVSSLRGHVYCWGSNRYDASMELHYAPDGSFSSPELGRKITKETKVQKRWLPCNFRYATDPKVQKKWLPCNFRYAPDAKVQKKWLPANFRYATDPKVQKKWLPCNFRLDLGGSANKGNDPGEHNFTEKCLHCLYKLMR